MSSISIESKGAGGFAIPVLLLAAFLVFSAVSCTAQPTEEQALRSLRDITSTGKLPPEAIPAEIESRYPGTRTAALARLLRALIKRESGDSNGAAALLESDIFAKHTNVGDHALRLRIEALADAGRVEEAMSEAERLLREYPGSMFTTSARLKLGSGLLTAGRFKEAQDVLRSLVREDNESALLISAQAAAKRGNEQEAVALYRRTYFFGAGSGAAKEAESLLKEMGEDLTPKTAEEARARADVLFGKQKFREAADALGQLAELYPADFDVEKRLALVKSHARANRAADAKSAFNGIPSVSDEKQEGYYELALAYARAKAWPDARQTIDELRQKFPQSEWTPKAMIDAGMEARDQKRRADESALLTSAVAAYPDAVDVAKAQFELAWLQHESGNFEISSRMLTEHLARYVDKDNTYRGQTGYWAARDSERAGKITAACALYDGTVFRYGANWYGYLAFDRLEKLRRAGKCQGADSFGPGSDVAEAVANLKVVTVAAETAGERELARLEKSRQLSAVGLFDWSMEELKEAKLGADNSPSVNLALAQHYRLKGDNVNALLALAKSYPDYAQMFPEEMTREEWDIFYPLIHWNDIKFWAEKRSLDPYHVAGLIRQETIFDPNARSSANAYGLMQLLIPTARMMERKYGSGGRSVTASALYDPAFNIELGTAYMKEQLSKYGRLEYMSVAYNAGPGRASSWTKSLPAEIDEFVENIPFRETKGYVKGVIRNSSQYRRLYDMQGRFKPNVGQNPVRAAIDSKPANTFANEFPNVRVERERTAAE